MSEVRVRPATIEDHSIIVEFNQKLAKESEDLTLKPEIITPGVEAALRDRSKATYLIAEVDGRIMGQLMITTEWSDWRNADIWWIQSVYVHPEARRQGIFKSLYFKAREMAQEKGVASLRLYVERENLTAQRAYEKLGMTQSHYVMMEESLR